MNPIEELAEVIGIKHGEFQVLEGTPDKADMVTAFYPGFMTKAKIITYKGEGQILKAMQQMVEEHLIDVTKTLKLIKGFRKTYDK